MNLATVLAASLHLPERTVATVLDLLDRDHTIPFIARYRKEATGSLDEVVLLSLRDERDRLLSLEKRRQAIVESLTENGHATEERLAAVGAFTTLAALEDYYLPFRPKRKTRASVALERGLGPLADTIARNREPGSAELAKFSGTSEVPDAAAALAGARDIVAERISESAPVRHRLRERFGREAILTVRARGSEPNPYHEHAGKEERLSRMPGHRLLAVLRGEAEKHLSISVDVSTEAAFRDVVAQLLPGGVFPVTALDAAIRDALKRLLFPSLGTESLSEARAGAEAGAIRVFASNLRQVLLAPPLGQKPLLALDPGLRTGCKWVALSAQGNLVEHGVVYPLEPHRRVAEAEKTVRALVSRHGLGAVAVGNGTGGRDAQAWVESLGLGLPVISVNESGASVYSASEVAREEFPEQDLTVRGAVSIGRRLMDPLAELVKVDPKAIGVGQYQHDVDQRALKQSLDDVVISCVNQVGVELNTASKPILAYVAGLNPRLAAAIVEHRNRKGPFRRRAELLEVKGVGPKAFEQAAGFLRIQGGDHPLEASAVHPESYGIVEELAKRAGCGVAELVGRTDLTALAKAADLRVGEATLADILAELEKPGRDPRAVWESPKFDDSVRTLDDLRDGLVLSGVVTNVTDFGAFVDIGVHQDGLVHISELSKDFVRHPLDAVKPGQGVKVMVLSVDKPRKRISLSRKACL